RIRTFSDAADNDIAISNDTDQLRVLDDRQRPDVGIPHLLGRLGERLVRADHLEPRFHHIPYEHSALLLAFRSAHAATWVPRNSAGSLPGHGFIQFLHPTGEVEIEYSRPSLRRVESHFAGTVAPVR